jgi:polycystin 2
MGQLSSTLSKCAKDIVGFCIMFFIVFFAYAQLGYLVFGSQLRDFSTFGDSVFTLFRIILGDFDFVALEDANRVLGPIFFVTYVFFVFFVLLNMFLAIINDTYGEVKTELHAENGMTVTDYFKKGYNTLLRKLTSRQKRVIDLTDALKDADYNKDRKIDFHEWKAEMKGRGHTDAEIEETFAAYDKDGDNVLSRSEQQQFTTKLEQERIDLDQEIKETKLERDKARASLRTQRVKRQRSVLSHGSITDTVGVSAGEFTILSHRVDQLEHSIESVMSKLDDVILKLHDLRLHQPVLPFTSQDKVMPQSLSYYIFAKIKI